MEEEVITASDNNSSGKTKEQRKKRVKRMKVAIVIVVIILLILPSLLCIILSLRINRLQDEVNDLISIHSDNSELSEWQPKDDSIYAYAAEVPEISPTTVPDMISLVPDEPTSQTAPDNISGAAGKDALGGQAEASGTFPLHLSLSQRQEYENATPEGRYDILSVLSGNNLSDNTAADWYVAQYENTTDSGQTALSTAETPGNTSDIKEQALTGSDKAADNNSQAAGTAANGKDIVGDADSSSGHGSKEKTAAKEQDKGIMKVKPGQFAGKKVYLTFDDGPSEYTDEILDILAEYKVKAAFFVVGATDKESKRRYKRIVEEGHTLGMHSYSHVYKQIYNSLEDFDKDFTKLWKLLYDTTGYKSTIYRFPGGSSNEVNKNGMDEFIRYLKDKSIVYYDWNVVNGDATDIDYTKEQLIDNVLNGVSLKKTSIVLMHDFRSTRTTVDSLPGLLEALITGGAEILPLDSSVTPIQQIKADEVK